MRYFYKVYGLAIESELSIDELIVLDKQERENIDVKISFETINPEIKEMINNGEIAMYEYNNMWFYINDTAIFHIVNGTHVYIDPCQEANYENIKIYILGAVLGMVLLQKNIIAIHGGGIFINNKGCVFTGDKGVGKSTLTTSLGKRGYKFISDDVCAIKTDDVNKYKICRGFAYHKLREDTMYNLGYDTLKATQFTSDEKIKKYIIPAFDEFVNYDVPFEYIFEICVDNVNKVQVEEVIGTKKLDSMISNIFKIDMLYYSGGIQPAYFKKCVEIVKNIKYYKITRPRHIFSVDEQIKLVEEILSKDDPIKARMA